ncbi:thermonuclease family protein [Nostoc sp. CHAB 5824]|nr:thermonuclease family protein [Nostoc sp. CHAB 5824]
MLQKIPFVAISVLLVAQMSLPVFANNLTATVVSVGDGDTIRVRTGNKTVTVRLACIDAPEMKQNPWGQQSSTRLKQLLPVGQGITLRPIETDKYKRLVAEIYVENRSINVNMVQEDRLWCITSISKAVHSLKIACCKVKTTLNNNCRATNYLTITTNYLSSI